MDGRGFWLLSAICCVLSCAGPSPEALRVVISPTQGRLKRGMAIRLSTAVADAEIFYTLDLTPPTRESLPYLAPIQAWGDITIRASAWRGKTQGPFTEKSFRVDALFPFTQIQPEAGSYTTPIQVRLQSEEKATIYATIDGSEPKASAAFVYRKPLTLTKDSVVRFFAVDAEGNREPLQERHYNFPPVLSVRPAPGLYTNTMPAVTIAANETDATLRFRWNQRTPGTWAIYRKPSAPPGDAELEIEAVDIYGIRSRRSGGFYGLWSPPKRTQTANSLLSEARAAVSVSLENVGPPAVIVATEQGLWRLSAQGQKLSTPTKLWEGTWSPRWLRSWDVDDDGFNDLIAIDAKGTVRLFRTLSLTQVVEAPKLLPLTKVPDLRTLLPADVDRDGQLDMIAISGKTGGTQVWQQRRGQYQALSKLFETLPGLRRGLAGDWNGDGAIDLLCLPLSSKPQAPFLLFGNGKLAFRRVSLEKSIAVEWRTVTWLHAAKADINADGTLDLVLLGQKAGTNSQYVMLTLLYRTGEGWQQAGVATWLSREVPRSLAVADLDLDSYPEIVVLGPSKVSVWKNVYGRVWMNASTQVTWPDLKVWTWGAFFAPPRPFALWSGAQQGWQISPATKHEMLGLRVVGLRGNRSGIGAQVQIQTATRNWLHEVGPCCTGPDQSALHLSVGLGTNNRPRRLQFRWSDGFQRELQSFDLSRITRVAPSTTP